MPDQNPQKDNQKNTKDIQDFEMGQSVASETGDVSNNPKINRYANETQKPPAPNQPPIQPIKVDPTATVPAAAAPVAKPATPASPAQTAAPQAAIPAQQAKPGMPQVKPGIQPPNPAAKKKVILGCLGAFGSLMLIFLVLSFVFLAQSGSGTSPIAKLLGVNQGVFVNGLIIFVHTIFILISLVAFVFTMVGLFKASMAPKTDKDARKAALKTSMISGILLFIILLIWGFTYVYLDSKRVEIAPEYLNPIITTPEEILGLSAPIEIKFDASNVPIDRNRFKIVSHAWDFGDKSTGTSQIVSHIFKEKGTYDVKLVVTVENKDTGETSIGGEYHVKVSIENEALRAIFKADPQSGEAPLEVEFDASESTDPDGNIDQYEWDLDGDNEFDDGKGETIKHTFEKVGKYKISLRVTSTIGEFNIAEKEIVVEAQSNPEAVITVVDDPKSYTIGESYIFNADNSKSPNGKITKYEWTFSDNPKKVETTKTISHVFKTSGTHEITLKVTDEKEKENETRKTIKVDAPKGSPKPVIKTEPTLEDKATTLSGKAPFTVTFNAKETTDSDNNIVDYKWDFENDATFDSFGNIVSHTYTEEGTYTVALAVVDADNNVGNASIVIKVEALGIVPILSADVIDGNIPLTVNFDASASSYSKGQITSYKWDFGDGTPVKIGSATISHKYTSIGTFTAEVTVMGSDNSAAAKSLTISVREIPLSACFVSVFEKGKAPLETSFDPGCSTGSVTSYSWDFADGESSTQVKPTHTFEKPGTYKVTLEVSDAENTISKAEVEITVTEE